MHRDLFEAKEKRSKSPLEPARTSGLSLQFFLNFSKAQDGVGHFGAHHIPRISGPSARAAPVGFADARPPAFTSDVFGVRKTDFS